MKEYLILIFNYYFTIEVPNNQSIKQILFCFEDVPISRKPNTSLKKATTDKKGENQSSTSKKNDGKSTATANGNGKSACETPSQKPKKKKTRTTFTAYQLEELERAFERAPYPGKNYYYDIEYFSCFISVTNNISCGQLLFLKYRCFCTRGASAKTMPE